MAQVTITLPAPTQYIAGFVLSYDGSIGQIPSALVDGGGAAFIRRIGVQLTGVTLRISETDSGGGTEAGPALTDEFITNGSLTFSFGSETFAVGPTDFAGDTSEPYFWEVSGGPAFINAVGNNAGVVVVISDGAGMVALPDAVAPSVAIGAVAAGDEFDSVALAATVTGGTYDALDYAWTVSGGTLDDASAASSTWTRPGVSADTDYTVDLTVTARGTGVNVASGTSATAAAPSVTATVQDTASPPPPVATGPAIALVSVDTAGGTITGGGQSWVAIDGSPVAVVGDAVASHPPCPNPSSHCAASMADGSSWVTIDGIPICRAGDSATCGHAATGSAFVNST